MAENKDIERGRNIPKKIFTTISVEKVDRLLFVHQALVLYIMHA